MFAILTCAQQIELKSHTVATHAEALQTDLQPFQTTIVEQQNHLAKREQELNKLWVKLSKQARKEAECKNQWEVEFWKCPKVNEKLGTPMFTFFQLGFDDCIQQFKNIGFPQSGNTSKFVDARETLNRVPKDLFSFTSEMSE